MLTAVVGAMVVTSAVVAMVMALAVVTLAVVAMEVVVALAGAVAPALVPYRVLTPVLAVQQAAHTTCVV